MQEKKSRASGGMVTCGDLTALETVGLIPSAPTLRPADLLNSAAVPGRLAALDVGIISPDANNAGEDCCQSMFARKRHDYAKYLDELEQREGIIFKSLIWAV